MHCIHHLLPVNLQKYIYNFTSSKWHAAFTKSDGKIRNGKLFYSLKHNSISKYYKKQNQNSQSNKIAVSFAAIQQSCWTQYQKSSKCILLWIFFIYRRFGNKWRTNKQSNCMSSPFARHINKKEKGNMKRILLYLYGFNINTKFKVNTAY